MSKKEKLKTIKKPREHFRVIFNKYDRDKDGYLSIKELDNLIVGQEYEDDIPRHVVEKIHILADTDGDGLLSFKEFVHMINHPSLEPLFGSMLHKYVDIIVPPKSHYKKTTKGQLADECRCCPPPIAMVLMSAIEIIFYCIDTADGSPSGRGPIAKAFIYDPARRYEAWRFVSYMFVHIGVLHLAVNVTVQVLLGTPLEMVHRWWRVVIIYFAGVIAGSLATSITDPYVRLAGASGGVYALMLAHIATIAMNWREMEYPGVQLIIFLIIICCDVGTAVHDRYNETDKQIGYAAHLAGAVAGLLVGIKIVQNVKVTRGERILWWASAITYTLLMGTGIVWNLAFPSHFPPQNRKKY